MKNRKFFSKSFLFFILLISATMVFAFSSGVVTATTHYVSTSSVGTDTSCASPGYNTISAAITAASSGDMINVCPGIYTEQLSITKSLTIVGAGASTTTILAPASMVVNLHNYETIIAISGSGVNVGISGFTISGPGTGYQYFAGIFVADGANANIHDNYILHIRPSSGNWAEVAILVGRMSQSTSATANITNNIITDYHKGGIVVDNTGSSANITNNIITGLGLNDYVASNGIQISRGAIATVINNTITNNEYLVDSGSLSGSQCTTTPSDLSNLTEVYADGCSTGSGILLYDAGAGTISADNNIVTNNDVGFLFAGAEPTTNTNAQINYNVIYGNRYFGIDASADTNTINGTYNDYHTCFPVQSAYAVADVSLNVFYVPFIAPLSCFTGGNVKLTAYTVKKAALICDSGASAPGSQHSPEIGGCVDDNIGAASGIAGNLSDQRFNQYLFTGEQLAELVVARDADGAMFLNPLANFLVGNVSKTFCTDVTSAGYQTGTLWYGHDVHLLLQTLPPSGFNPTFDKIYNCLWTVTSADSGSQSIKILIGDAESNIALTNSQLWYLNPAIGINVHFDSGTSIQFPSASAGSTVLSNNTMIITNTAAGGVDLVTYLVGRNDLTDTSGHGLCPGSNTLNINDMSYRCVVDSLQSETWTPLSHLKENNGCTSTPAVPASPIPTQCEVQDGWRYSNLILPDASNSAFSIIGNGHMAQCQFQLNIPFPCIGTYSASNAVDVLVRAL